MATISASRRVVAWASLAVLLQLRAPDSLQAAEPVKKNGEIEVRIQGADGQPVGVGATASRFSYDRDWHQWRRAAEPQVTDADGKIRYSGLEVTAFLLVVRNSAGELALKDVTLLDESPRQDVELRLARPVVAKVKIHDPSGAPIAGAKLHGVKFSSDNGTVSLPSYSLADMGLDAQPSNASGELELPALPAGGKAELRFMHADYAPAVVKGVAIAAGPATDVQLEPGVRVTFRVPPGQRAPKMMIDLRREPFEHPSTLIGYHVEFDEQGEAHLTITAGEYDWLRLTNPDFVVTPIYSATPGKKSRNFTVTPEQNWFAFDFKPKVRVQGRMVDAATGKRVTDSYVQGEVAATGAGGPFADFAEKWTHVDWADPEADGHFEIKLAAGPARLTGGAQGYTAPEDNLEVDVAADGSTVARDIVLSPMPKVRGIVTTSDGRPIAQAIVRFGGSELGHVQPVATDAEGRFELTPPWIPIDQETQAHLPKQSIVAFHPLEPLGGRAEISLDDPKSLDHVAVTLAPQEIKQLLASIVSQIGVRKKLADPAEQKKNEERSLVGKAAPELDGVTWLNTDKPQMTLADFRGKYVLLDFWTTWCGPCHADFPGVRLLHDLYKDKGFVIIGVHDNSMPLAAVEADVKKESLRFPIVVDHADGRILEQYKAHGLSGYPSYVLIGPDGNVVRDEDTTLGPSLRVYMIENVREVLLGTAHAR